MIKKLNFDELMGLLKKPELWQRSSEPFWDDEHISKGMLEAHLDPDEDGASRKLSTIDKSVAWLSGVLPGSGTVLDLGCGPGLYAKRLAMRGYEVTGIDFSKRSIAYAKSQDDKANYIYQNYLDTDYDEVFDEVLLIYCDYAALISEERQKLLSKIWRSLKPGGVFVFDVFTDKHFAQKREKTLWRRYEKGGFWSSEPHIYLEASFLYENNTVAADKYVVITAEGVKEYVIWDTVYSLERLKEEVAPFGFNVKGVFDDACGRAYTGHSETLCMVLEK